jgi:hypothetical protein
VEAIFLRAVRDSVAAQAASGMRFQQKLLFMFAAEPNDQGENQ